MLAAARASSNIEISSSPGTNCVVSASSALSRLVKNTPSSTPNDVPFSAALAFLVYVRRRLGAGSNVAPVSASVATGFVADFGGRPRLSLTGVVVAASDFAPGVFSAVAVTLIVFVIYKAERCSKQIKGPPLSLFPFPASQHVV
ncbi:hypothetical protein GGI06_001625 [Coemansia sp. S85]|nr:hypothetical protein GGI06_001625 [Coemansia sp. S85]